MAAAKEITLKVNIDPSGAVSGAKAVAGGAAEATEAIKKINVSLGNLNSAYAVGRAAVDKYNTEMAVLDALERHNLDTKNKLGKELAESVRQNIALVAAVKASEQALRAQEAAERSALSAKIAKRTVQDQSAVALYQEVQALKGLYAAYQGGEGAVDAYNKKMFVKNALLEAGRTLQSQEGQAVAADAAKHWDLTAAISAAEKSIRQKSAAFEAAHAAALADNAAMDLAKQKTDAFVASIQAEVARLQGLAAAYNGGRSGIAAFNLAHEIETRQMRAGTDATSKAGQAIDQFTRQEYAARDAVNKLEKELKAQEKATQNIKPSTDKATYSLTAFQTAIGTLATVALNKLKNEMVGARQSFDRMTNTFAISSGSAGEAADKMAFLRDNAQKLGLDIQSVGVSFAKFDVAAQNTSLSSAQVRDIFVSVSEATTAMGLSSEVAEGAILALQQMISKGTVQSEELRGQFAERIPGAFRLAAEAMGWTQLELAKNLEQGRVLSEDLLPKLAAKLHEVFGPGSISGAKLLSAELNRLKNEWFDFLVSTSQTIHLPQLVAAVTASFGALIETIKTLLALAVVLWFESAIAKLKLFKVALLDAASAAKVFWSSIGGLVTIGIALIAEGTHLLYDQIKKSEKESDEAILRIIANTNQVKTQFDILRSLQDKLAGRNDQPITPEERLAPKLGLDKAKEDLKNVLDLIKELEKSKARLPGKVDESIELDVTNLEKIEAVSKTGSKSLADLRVEAGVLAVVVEKANARFHWMTSEMDDVVTSSKRAIEAEKTYQETLKQIQQDFEKGEFKRLGGLKEQLAEVERQKADALKARQNATTPGLAKSDAKELRESASAANAYQKEIDRMLKKYDEFNTAQKNFDDAMALANELYEAGKFGAKGSAEAQERLNEIKQNGANILMDELSPGLRQANEEMAKLNIQMDNQLASNSKMLSAYKSGADAVDEQTRAIGIAAITEDILTKAKANSVTIDDGYIESTKRKAAAVYDSNIETELANKLYEDTSAIQNAIDQNEQYVIALNAGSEALMDVAAYQAAYNAIVKPGAKITAEMWLAIMKLADANKELAKSQQDVSATKLIDDLKYETEWMEKYAVALKGGQGALEAFNIQKQIADALRSGQIGKDDVIEFEAQLKASSLAKIKVDLAKITHDFKEDMWSALEGGLKTFLTELGEGNKDAVKNLGKNLQASMLEAVAKWLSAMLVAIAKAALASKAISGGSSSSGGGGFMGALKGLFGGGGAGGGAGISSGAMALGAWVAVAAAAVAILKHQVDRANAVRYQTTVSYNSGSDTMFSSGKLNETGAKIADAFKSLLDEVQSATGALLDGAHRAAIAVRNDKKGFRALVDGVVIGTFKTMDEAIVAAMKKLFSAENLKNSLNPIVQQVIDNFDASKGPDEFAAAIKAVTQIMNDLSGLTDIEIQLRDLPAQASQLASQLHAMGVSMGDAAVVAEQWTVQQFASIRDQITGHEASAAEQMAERQRQAAMFNAQLAMSKANMELAKAELEHKIAIFGTEVEWVNRKYEFDLIKMRMRRDLIDADMSMSNTEVDIASWRIGARNELASQDMEIARNEFEVRRAAGGASLAALQIQLDAINQAMAALDAIKPIDMAEIHLPNPNGGRGGNTGPNIIDEFWSFWKQKQRDAMSEVAGAIYDINEAYDAQVKAARRLGMEEELEAARLAELARLRADFLESYRSENLTDYQRAVEELNAAFDDQALLDEYIGQEEELARVRHEAMARLREDLLDSFGSPMESVRDNLTGLIKRFIDLDKANSQLGEDFRNGTITAEEYADALAHSEQVQREFNDQMAVNLLNMAVYFTDALGDSEKSAEIRARLAEFEYNMKLAEFELTLETAYAQHWINQELYEYLLDILNEARRNPPDFTVPTGDTGGGGDTSGSNPLEDTLQALLRALDRLRNILQTYTDFLKDLQTSELSPYSISDQYDMAQAEYERLLALAQAGDLNAMEQLPAAAQSYLDLASQMFGTASAGYSDIFNTINEDMTAIMGSIQDILDQVPSQYQPIEQRLDTIAEILDNMYLLWMNFDTTGSGTGGGGGFTPPGTPTQTPRTLQEVFEAYNLDWSQLNGTELGDLTSIVQSILEDSQVSISEMSDFVSTMENMLGMTPGSMTAAQIAALRTWLFQQVGNNANGPENQGAAANNQASQSSAVGGTPSISTNNHAARMNRNLELIAELTAKGLRESSSDRNRKPKLSYAGYTGGRNSSVRGS